MAPSIIDPNIFTSSFNALVVLWVVSHILVLFTLIQSFRGTIFVVIGILIIAVYWIKPYSYDMEKYATYYETGYLEAFGKKGETYNGIQMHSRDLTGDPFSAYEYGFDFTVKTIRRIFPEGQLVRRIELPSLEYNKTGFSMDPLLIFFIAAALLALFYSYRNLSYSTDRIAINSMAITIFLVTALGSIFFFMGSQNTIRQ